MTEIALFPIPNLVSFPGSLVPLHIFEPRYRALVKESVKLGRFIGVAHAKRVVSEAEQSSNLAEKLNKNQDTYEPFEVFSAGPCEITDVTGDGRILAEIKMEKRFKLGEMIQEVPYKVYLCEDYNDLPDEPDDLLNIERKRRLDEFLIQSVENGEGQLKKLLESDSWKSLPLSNYGFSVFQLLKFDPEKMQEILELKTIGGRLDIALKEAGLSL